MRSSSSSSRVDDDDNASGLLMPDAIHIWVVMMEVIQKSPAIARLAAECQRAIVNG